MTKENDELEAAASTSEAIEKQDARTAIDGCIAFGRMGVKEPPAGHWLTEYWHIGRQLAKLGETSAWDNQTPVTAPADGADQPLYIAKLRNGSITWLEFVKEAWDRLDSTWDRRVAVLSTSAEDKRDAERASEPGDRRLAFLLPEGGNVVVTFPCEIEPESLNMLAKMLIEMSLRQLKADAIDAAIAASKTEGA
jgi:hypothetical protein